MEKLSAASTSNHGLQRLHATESRGALPKTNGRLRSCRRRCEDLCFPAAPGRKARHDYEHERNGVAHLFMMFAPLEGWRHVKVTDRHAAVDYAHVLKDLSDTHFPNAAKIVLVQDNLSTHTPASLYAASPPPAEARRLSERFEWHCTPKHGSWLDMAESELGALATQCLDRRIPSKLVLIAEVAAWRNNRNKYLVKADWRFTTHDARVRLKTLYPQFQ
jgi:DDE superfamily endonuclease